MAKKFRRLLAMAMILTLCIAHMALPASAWGWNDHHDNKPGGGSSNQQEWYEVYFQGVKIASGYGGYGNVYYLGTHYRAGVTFNGSYLTWYINPVQGSSGNFGGTINMNDYITIPEGFTVKEYEVLESSISGVNDAVHDMYDNAVIKINIKTIYNEETGEEMEMSSITVNHNYYTKDLYTDETVKDGSSSNTAEALEGSSFTATPVTAYGDNTYEQTTDASALTITVNEDASLNVINIDYLRTIDTTPEPVQTSVTVNHNYYTKDLYTGETTFDGSTSDTIEALEGNSFTAIPVTTYGDNTYEQTTDASALTITVDADEELNVISIDYLRTIDTTPEPTDPEPTEPEPTEPEPTEPEPTEPEPTEPEPTEPEPTEPEPTEPEPTEPEVTEPVETEPVETEPAKPDNTPVVIDGYVEIPDEDVPLADVPKTGDASLIWAALSLVSGGMYFLNKKREED